MLTATAEPCALSSSEIEQYATRYHKKVMSLARKIAKQLKHRDPEEFESIALEAFFDALRSYSGVTNEAQVWARCVLRIRSRLFNEADASAVRDEHFITNVL